MSGYGDDNQRSGGYGGSGNDDSSRGQSGGYGGGNDDSYGVSLLSLTLGYAWVMLTI